MLPKVPEFAYPRTTLPHIPAHSHPWVSYAGVGIGDITTWGRQWQGSGAMGGRGSKGSKGREWLIAHTSVTIVCHIGENSSSDVYSFICEVLKVRHTVHTPTVVVHRV